MILNKSNKSVNVIYYNVYSAMRIRYCIAKKSNIHSMDKINRDSMPENYPYDFWEKIIAKHLSWVAKNGLDIVGYILVDLNSNNLDIVSFAVNQNYRNKGIGNKLLKNVVNNTKYKTHLYVRSKNISAIHLYNKYGFKKINTISEYYDDPTDDAYDMLLDR